jgi:hypothetical protein
MGYSKAAITVERMRPNLGAIENGQPCVWSVAPGQEDRFAYKIREALYAAAHNSHRFPQLAAQADRFTIEILDVGKVQARLSDNTPAQLVNSSTPAEVTPVHGLAPHSSPERPLSVVGLKDVRAIIQYWLRAQPTNQAMTFPDADLGDADLQALARFCAGRSPAWVVVKIPNVNVISLHPIGGDYPQTAVVQVLYDTTPEVE